ncbi:MAG: metabolite traffic protein EboE [Bacteroidota bacterium]
MLIREHLHLSYCTNIHPGENWKITFDHLQENVPAIKQHLSPNGNFGLGLRLSNTASEELGLSENLEKFKTWLDTNGIYVFTMNGFPYGNFHHERVKDKVHTPDWTTKERLEYTKRLFKQLVFLLPPGISGGISTSPISYKHWHGSDQERKEALRLGADHMAQIAVFLYELERETGKYLHLDIEPEPDGLLENTKDVLSFFNTHLVEAAHQAFAGRAMDASTVASLLKKYINLCYDVCHYSLAYEDPKTTFAALQKNGIRVGKIQVSAALKIVWNSAAMDEVWEMLSEFDEPTYLHQVTEVKGDGVITYRDLPDVLERHPKFSELRAHFHVPIFLKEYGYLQSTQEDILKVVAHLREYPTTAHLEVETYTWEVLPPELKLDVKESIVRELHWLKEKLV